MTDKQSTVVVSQELLERITKPLEKMADVPLRRKAILELRALLAAPVEQATNKDHVQCRSCLGSGVKPKRLPGEGETDYRNRCAAVAIAAPAAQHTCGLDKPVKCVACKPGEPVAWRVTGRNGLTVTAEYPRWAINEPGLTVTPLYLHAQPPIQSSITMADVMRAHESAARKPLMVGTSNWCAHMAEQLNTPK